MDRVKAKQRYWEQKGATKGRVDASGKPVLFLLTFDEWFDWWAATGRWKLRGCGEGQYCMCRYNDLGNYETGNIYCGLATDNIRLAQQKPKSEEMKRKLRKPKTDEHKRKLQANLNAVRPKQKVITPDGEFESTYAAGRHYGITGEAVMWRCKQSTGKYKEWTYANN